MKKQLIMDVNRLQTRVALVEDGRLAEYYVERTGRERLVGNIYKGKVMNVLPGMDAAFVNIGLDKNAFLYAGDVALNPEDFEFGGRFQADVKSIRDLVRPGQELMVQVVKEPGGTKGARITTHVTLPGHLMVLVPNMDYVGVSRRIENEEERERLRQLVESIRPEGMGIIVRTAAAGAVKEDMAEIDGLLSRWKTLQKAAQEKKAPCALLQDSDLILRSLRDMAGSDVERVVINEQVTYKRIVEMITFAEPHIAHKISLFEEKRDIFDHFDLETQVDKSFERKVWLPSGGYLVFDHTEALSVIDVNTGKYVGENDFSTTILKNNLEAAAEIARQIRLRDIGGIIVIDFIDMMDTDSQLKVVDALKEALSKDRTRSNVVGMTGLGLVEMTRKKMRQRVSAMMHTACPHCHGSGRVLNAETIALRVFKEYRKLRMEEPTQAYTLVAHKDVVSFLAREKLMDGKIELSPADKGSTGEYFFSVVADEE